MGEPVFTTLRLLALRGGQAHLYTAWNLISLEASTLNALKFEWVWLHFQAVKVLYLNISHFSINISGWYLNGFWHNYFGDSIS